MSFHHFKALLKKNFLILKRTYILTFFEIVSPMIVMLVLLLTNSKFDTEYTQIHIDNQYLSNNCSFITTNYRDSSFCQNHKYMFVYRCRDSIIALIGKKFPIEIEERIRNIYSELYIDDDIEPKFRHFDSVLELNDYVESKNYKKMTKICFGISYEKEWYKYIFKLHFFASKYLERNKYIANIPSSNIDPLDPFRVKPDFDSYHLYLRSGYLMIQKILYDYVLREETRNENAEINYKIIPQKYEEKTFNLLHQYLNQIISIFVLISYAFPLSINIYRLIKEKESKAKELMKIMGLNEFNYYFSYFVIYFFINLLHAIFNALIVKYILNYIEYGYLFILFFLYGLVIFSLIFFFQSFLEKANISIIFCLLVYAIMYFIGMPLQTNAVNKAVKILFALLFPPINVSFGCITIAQFQKNSNKFNGRVNMNYDKYSVCDMYIVFIFNFILYIFIGFYLQNVLEHQYGFNKPWNFLCMKSYWNCDKKNKNKKLENLSLRLSRNILNKSKIKFSNIKKDDNDLESKDEIKNNIKENDDNTQAINVSNLGENYDDSHENKESDDIKKIKNSKNNKKYNKDNKENNSILKIKYIKKNFGDKIVLQDVTFDLNENEIFVLLGHNGAGKTTLISILSGLIKSTSGSAYYNDEINNKEINILSDESIESFHRLIGICPQHDVLFEDLTVEEHLELYCEFKSVDRESISEEITSVLKDIQLEKKRHTKASDLSGGQKRKLSIGLALVGGSSIIFLDEPTSGMDITSRRNLWEILKKCLTGKIIILTTHFMEEAQVLGNRIGILSEGKMQRIDTPLKLIEDFTNNIKLNITKHSDADDDSIIAFFLDKFGDHEISFENFNKDILFRIPINNICINWTEFFKQLDANLTKYRIKHYSISKSTLEDVFINFNKNVNNIDNDKKKEIYDNNKKKSLNNSVILFNKNNYDEINNCCSKFLKDFKISFKKRIFQIIREKKTIILEILCPIILTIIGCLVSYIEFLEENRTFPLNLNQITNDTQIIFYNIDNTHLSPSQLYNHRPSEDLSNIKFEPIYFSRSSNDYITLLNIINEIYDVKKRYKYKNYIYYDSFYIDEINNQYGLDLIVDITPRQAAPIYANFILNNVIRHVTGNNYLEIEMINEPLPYTYEEKKEKKIRNQFKILFFIALGFSLIPSNFITVIIKERENNSKHLQIISGISLFGYWFNNYIFDLIKYYFIGGICLIFLLAFGFYEKYFVILYLEYGPAMISFTYLFSLILKTEYMGQISVLLINLIFGAIFGIAVIIMRLYDKLIKYADNFAYVLRIIPSFCFCYGYNQLLNKDELFSLDKNITNVDDNTNIFFNQNEIDENILKLKHVGMDCIYLAIESLIYLLILIVLENVLNKNCFRRNINLSEYPVDRNIYLGGSRLEPEDKNYAIKVKNLCKIYYDKCCNKIEAVKNISFNLESGEIFGFLGTNGAGKTTTFKCLSNEISPSYGNIYIHNYDITKDFNKVRNLIGYCPQFDTIFEFLTVYENLKFYGSIKGAKESKLDEIIKALIEEMNLTEFTHKISGTLSGGNKRKLSVAIALICNPPIILLDEPSTGMDPEARRHMWKAIYNISINKKKSTIIMTTHSMEEAESLCKKIGILVDGQFKCLGTSDEIKNKEGFGFELNLQIKEPDVNTLFQIFRLNLDHINQSVGKDSFDEDFNNFGINKYKEQFKPELFGGKLLKELNNKGTLPLKKIVRWMFYVKSVLKLIQKIKEYFETIFCVDYKDNNFAFRIERKRQEGEKTIGFLFGFIEDNKKKFNVGQFFLQYSTLEQIFNEYAGVKSGINIEINQEILDCFC